MAYQIGRTKPGEWAERINGDIARAEAYLDAILVDLEVPNYHRLLDMPFRATEFEKILNQAAAYQVEMISHINSAYAVNNNYTDITAFKTALDNLKAGIITNANLFILTMNANGDRLFVTPISAAAKTAITNLINAVKATIV